MNEREALPGPARRWQHGDECEVMGRSDGPFLVLVVSPHTLLCTRADGRLIRCQADRARLIAKAEKNGL